MRLEGRHVFKKEKMNVESDSDVIDENASTRTMRNETMQQIPVPKLKIQAPRDHGKENVHVLYGKI